MSSHCDFEALTHELNADLALRSRDQSRDEIIREWCRRITITHGSECFARMAVLLRIIEGEPTVAVNKKLVFVLHGIHDQGEWMDMVQEELQSANVIVQPLDFEFFDFVRFMSGFGVRSVIDRVLVRMRQAKADNPNSELIVIAHSFGTYVVTIIARDETDLRFDRAIFCGSVVPRGFRFDRVAHCPRIINECGGRDIWPVIAQGFCLGWRHKYGAAGVWGLRCSGVNDRFHDGGHSSYLHADFVQKFWKPYIENGDIVKSGYQGKRRVAPYGVSVLSYGWRVLFVGVVASVAVGTLFWLKGGHSALGYWCCVAIILWICFLLWVWRDVHRFCRPKLASQ